MRRQANGCSWSTTSPRSRSCCRRRLRFAGFTVTSADNGRQALEAARREPPDLVLLDVMLPDLDGFEVIRRLGTLPRGGGRPGPVPVLFLTARDGTADKINGLRLGGDDYVTKPFDLEELLARIRAILRRTGASPGTHTLTVADLEVDPRRPAGDQGGRSRCGCRRRSSGCCTTWWRTRGGCCRRRRSCSRCGATTSPATPASSTPTSAICAARSTPATPKLIHTVHGVGYVLRKPKPMIARLSLRARLLAITVALLVTGLAVISVGGGQAARDPSHGQNGRTGSARCPRRWPR